MKRFLFLSTVFILTISVSASADTKPTIQNGKQVTLAYKLFVKGTLLESAGYNTPFTYIQGQHQIVPGLEKGLLGLRVGEKKTVRVTPQEAFGFSDPKAFHEIEKDKLPPDIPREKGTLVEARDPKGMARLVKIVEVKEKTIVMDFNHPLAGKELEFQVEVLNIK